MLRGINRQDIFEDDEDYRQMTGCLRSLTERYDEMITRTVPMILKSGDSIVVSSSTFAPNDIVSVVSEEGELINKYYLTGNSCKFPIPNDNFYIAACRHNYYPYVKFFVRSGYIQNETISINTTYSTTPLYIGYDVTLDKPFGNVVINRLSRFSRCICLY